MLTFRGLAARGSRAVLPSLSSVPLYGRHVHTFDDEHQRIVPGDNSASDNKASKSSPPMPPLDLTSVFSFSGKRQPTAQTKPATSPKTAGAETTNDTPKSEVNHAAAGASPSTSDPQETLDDQKGDFSIQEQHYDERAAAKASVPEAHVLSFIDRISSLSDAKRDRWATVDASKRFDKKDISFVGPSENLFIECSKLAARHKQQGPYMGLGKKDVMVHEVDTRNRRAIERVPKMEAPYVVNETSFRRLPVDARLPDEHELRIMYPLSSNLPIHEAEAFIGDNSCYSVDEEPLPLRYFQLLPENFDPAKEYPFMVVLPDGKGDRRDFEDVCAHFFERPNVRQGLIEQQFVIFAPVVNVKRSLEAPIEAVVAHFCDWVVKNFNVEHGKVHLFGKGFGAYAALRTCLEQKNVALSCVAILGRNGTPHRPMDRTMDKVKNFENVHSLMYVPGFMRKQEWAYKFKFMLDYMQVRPAMRTIHFANVRDHQIYYAINPHEFWNHMRYFRQASARVLSCGTAEGHYSADVCAEKDGYHPAFTSSEIHVSNVNFVDPDSKEGIDPEALAEEQRKQRQRPEGEDKVTEVDL